MLSKRCDYRFDRCFDVNRKLKQHRFVQTGPKPPTSGWQNYKIPLLGGAGFVTGTVAYIYFSGKPGSKPSDRKKEEIEEEEIDDSYLLRDQNLDEAFELLEKLGSAPYLLVGAGTASFAAFRAIRAQDPTAKILIIGDEYYYPYMRPPLSKEIWYEESPEMAQKLSFKQWNGKERSIFFEHDDFYCSVKDLIDNKNGGVSVLRGIRVVRIDPSEQIAYLDNGKSLSYQKCLLAPGGKPRNLPVFMNADDDVKKHVSLFRGVKDFKKLHRITKKAKSVVIVGGGFLGSELACALGKKGKSSGLSVTQIFPESGNMGKVLPEYLSHWTTEKVHAEGVNVITGSTIDSVRKDGKKIVLKLNNGQEVSVDHVVISVGLEPNTDLATVSDLEVDEKHGGYLVNAELEARKNLWIAGDASCFYDVKLGRRRVEHHDHAVVSGRLAGENMTGKGKPYWHQSMFWSDLGPEIGYEAIGIVDSMLPTVGIFAKATEEDTPKAVVEATGESVRSETEEAAVIPQEISIDTSTARPPEPGDNFGKGVIFYLRDNIIVGIVLWNVFTKMPIARKIINEAKPYDDLNEVAKLFNLHSQ